MLESEVKMKLELLKIGNNVANFLVPLGLMAPYPAALYSTILRSKDSDSLHLILLLYTVLSQLDIVKIDSDENELKNYRETINTYLEKELNRIYSEKALPKIIEKIDNEIVPSINILLNQPSKDDALKQFKDEVNALVTIPNKFHAIWFGNLPDQNIRDNLANFSKINSDCQVFLWIDSGTYNTYYLGYADEWDALKAWAKENNILICDLNPQPGNLADNDIVFNRADVYQDNPNKIPYDFQINGKDCNYSALSDIARANILRIEGGIYIDCNDVYPKEPINNLYAPNGFLVHDESLGNFIAINGDIWASVPGGKFVDEYQKQTGEMYKKLILGEAPEIYASRNSNYGNYVKSDNSRQTSGILLGPGVVASLAKNMKNYQINLKYFHLPKISFDLCIIDDIDFKELQATVQNFDKNTILIAKTNGKL